MEFFLITATLKQRVTAIFSVTILIGGVEAEKCLLSRVPHNFFQFITYPAKFIALRIRKISTHDCIMKGYQSSIQFCEMTQVDRKSA